jgi:predicted nucleotidyltransferase
MQRNEILEILSKQKERYRKTGIEIIGVFGSYAKNEATERSDIDILVSFDERMIREVDPFLPFRRLRRMREELSKLLGKPVDIAEAGSLNEIAKKYISKEIVRV